MRRVVMVSVGLLAAIGCNSGDNLPGGNDGSSIPDPAADLGPDDDCAGYTNSETGEFTPVSGATAFWVGDFDLIEDEDGAFDVEGTETWYLFPNDEWKETNPDHAIECTIVVTAAGVLDRENTCPSCDYRLSLDLRPNEDASDCHPEFYNVHEGDLTGTIEYDVQLDCPEGNGACDATFTFASSGNELGTGYAASDRVTYTSDRLCEFF